MNSRRRFRFFKHIGVLTGDFDAQKAITDKISRVDFSVYLAKALNFDGAFKDIYFTDVDSTHPSVNEIGFLVENGIISMSDDNKFYPDEPLKGEHAIKMMFKANGYDVVADATGGYPLGYVLVAQRLKLISDIENMDALTVAEALVIMYRSMAIGLYSPVAISDGATQYTEDEITLLSVYWNLYEGEGQVQSFYGASITDSYTEEAEAIISGEKYLNNDVDLSSLLASEIEYVYYKDSDSKELIYAKALDEDNITVINSEDITDFDTLSYTVQYFNNNVQREKRLSRQMKFIYNGRLYNGALDTVFNKLISGESKGEIKIKLINNQEYVIVKAYSIYVIGNTTDNNTVLYNKFNAADKKDLTEYEQLSIKNANGRRNSDSERDHKGCVCCRVFRRS